jgi:vacuolar-type H+-ATPase subunit C/Vma6
MTRRATLAYAHARLRACKSRLLTRSDAAPLWTAADAKAMHRVVEALGVGDPWRRVLQVYAAAIRTGRKPLFDVLLRRHEIENVKLLWRVAIMHRPHAVIRRLWIDLGAFASLLCLDGETPNALAAQLAGTPYAGIATTVARAHGNDLAAAELAFDRWVTQCLLAEARTLPRREAMTRRLVELVVREREAQLELRGAKWYGLESITPRGNVDVVAIRIERLRLCRRAFIGSPFRLAPAIAVVLLAEEELRAVRALIERQGDERLDAAVMRTAAASQIGVR